MITGKQLEGIRKAISKLDADTASAIERAFDGIDMADREAVERVIYGVLKPIISQAADLSAQLAASVYNAWRMADIGEALQVEAMSAMDDGKFAAMANTAMEKPTLAEAANVITGYTGYTTRASYSGTLFRAAKSDPKKPRFARVPIGLETCDFCMMLASRGFEYPKGKEGEKVHNHAHCQCVYVASWSKSPKAEGYDPDEWYDRWKDSVDAEAEERAQRNGTTSAEERSKIMERYQKASAKSKARSAYVRNHVSHVEKQLKVGNSQAVGRTVGSDVGEREREYGVMYGSDSVVADLGLLKSEQMRSKFMSLGHSDDLNKALYDNAVSIIEKNTGTKRESLVLINADTLEVFRVDSAIDSGIVYNDEISDAVNRSQSGDARIVSLHNHPEGYPPSADDFMKAFDNKYEASYAIGHNGQLYSYANKTVEMTTKDCDAIQNDIALLYSFGYDVDAAYTDALAQRGLKYEIVG